MPVYLDKEVKLPVWQSRKVYQQYWSWAINLWSTWIRLTISATQVFQTVTTTNIVFPSLSWSISRNWNTNLDDSCWWTDGGCSNGPRERCLSDAQLGVAVGLRRIFSVGYTSPRPKARARVLILMFWTIHSTAHSPDGPIPFTRQLIELTGPGPCNRWKIEWMGQRPKLSTSD